MFLTIFTPTYNRASYLPRLFDSLNRQTLLDFEWILVDDGSDDDTKAVANTMENDAHFPMTFISQRNQGKHVAYNTALGHVHGDYFVCVDSDDYLVDTAVEDIKSFIEGNASMDGWSGILAKRFATTLKPETVRGRLFDMYESGAVAGDTMLIYKADVVRKYRFPVFDGEKFCPEYIIYDQIDCFEGDLLIFDKLLYLGDYLEGGLSKTMPRLIASCPAGSLKAITQRISLFDRSMSKQTIADYIRFNGVLYAYKEKYGKLDRTQLGMRVNRMMSFITKPAGYMMYLCRYRNKSKT